MRPPRGPHHGIRKAFLLVAGLLSVILAIGSGVAIGGIRYAEVTINTIESGPGCTENACVPHVLPCTKQACNFLILGSDSRAGLSKGEQSQYGSSSQVTGQRSDSILFVHQDFANHRTIVVSIPRDLRVTIPGHGLGKINSAFGFGPDVAVQAVEKLFHMPINHFVEINFQGFMNVVNAMGGVDVCVNQPMIDTLSGLNLPHAGCYTLKGRSALAFVRARHVQGDAIPDFSRISRQQQFIRAALQKIQSPGQLANLPKLIHALAGDFVRDDKLSLYTIKDLSAEMATIGSAGVEFRVVPSVPASAPIGGVDYVLRDEPTASRFFRLLRQDKPLGKIGQGLAYTNVSPAIITIRIYDANSGGKAERVEAYLRKAGFDVLGIEAAPAGSAKSRIVYGPDVRRQEAVVSSYLPRVPEVFAPNGTSGASIYLFVGQDFPSVP